MSLLSEMHLGLRFSILVGIRAILGGKRAQLKHNLKAAVWYIQSYKNFKSHLQENHSIRNLSIYRFSKWHHGAYYFKGEIDNRLVFVKTDFEFDLLSNEAYSLQLLAKSIPQHIPKLVLSATNEYFPFVALEYIEAISLREYFYSEIKEKNKENVLHRLIPILEAMQELGIVHRDIKAENFLIEQNTSKDEISIFLIDFVFSISVESSSKNLKELSNTPHNREILRYLGEGNQPEPFLWDDAYSLIKMCEDLIPDFQYKYPVLFATLTEKLHKFSYRWPDAR